MIRFSQLIVACLFATTASSANLVIEKPISVMGLNGMEFKEKTIELEAGEHQLVARYSYPLPEKGNKKKRIQSEVKVFTFVIEDDQSITMVAPIFNRFSQAEFAFNNDKIDWSFIDQDGNAVPYMVEHMPGIPGVLPYNDIERVISNFNDKYNIAVDSKLGIVDASDTAVTIKSAQIARDNANLQQLQDIYLQLSKEEQKAFRKWLVDID